MRERDINRDYLQNSAAELFGEKVRCIKIDPIEEGFSGKAYKLSLIRRHGAEDYFLKEIEDQKEHLVYTELIHPIGLPAPFCRIRAPLYNSR